MVNEHEIPVVAYMVDTKHYCVWDDRLPLRAHMFLRNIDFSYFDYMADTFERELAGENSKSAALSLRISFGHALETFVSFLAAAIQAPDAVFAWLGTYRPGDLLAVAQKILDGTIPTSLDLEPPILNSLSAQVHASLTTGDDERDKGIADEYAKVWTRLVQQYLQKVAKAEYNSLKHGLRVEPGGFSVSVAKESTPGVMANPANARTVTAPQYGSSFTMLERICTDNRQNLRVVDWRRGWDPARYARALKLMAASAQNIAWWLLVSVGEDPGDLSPRVPEKPGFASAVLQTAGETEFSMGSNVSRSNSPLSNEHIAEIYRAKGEGE